MDTSFFIKGLIFGFSIAAPVGPIGILCIRRSLAHGWTSGLLVGMGAATADAFYGCVAGFGLTYITQFLVGQRVYIQVIGGLFLCWLGIRIFLSRTDGTKVPEKSGSAAIGYLSSLFLTLTNPMTILSFAAVFAGMGLAGADTTRTTASWLVAGVFSGSMAWWFILSSASSLLNSRMNEPVMGWINRISGVVLTGFGLVLVIGLC